MADPGKRGPGFGISVFSSIALAILGIVGLVQAWMVTASV